MLRRNISKLLAELELNIQYTSLSAKSKKTIESHDIVERRVAFLEDILMERCYLAFSQLVADSQYAVLGLMLMGMLARVKTVIRPLRGEIEADDGSFPGRSLDAPEGKEVHDFGEAIRREEFHDMEAKDSENKDERDGDNDLRVAMTSTKSKKEKQSTALKAGKESLVEDSIIWKQPKKKRENGDAFDDLFAGLI